MHTSTRKTANLTLTLATSCLLLIAGCSGSGGDGGSTSAGINAASRLPPPFIASYNQARAKTHWR